MWVLKNDRTVTMRPVKRGQATVDKVQVVTGLQVGEKVKVWGKLRADGGVVSDERSGS